MLLQTHFSSTIFPLFNRRCRHLSPLLLRLRSRFTALSQAEYNQCRQNSSASSPWFSILRTSIATKNLRLGKCAHARILTSGNVIDRFLTNNLINMYSKCGSLSYARHLFDKNPDRDLVTWNSILSGYALTISSEGETQQGLLLFLLMLRSGVMPNWLTLAPVLKLCLLSGILSTSEAVHCYTVKLGSEQDVFVSGALVNIYSKFGQLGNARYLFDGMSERDTVLWNVMLKAYGQAGFDDEVFSLFSSLHRSGLRPDYVSVLCALEASSESEQLKTNAEQVRAYAIKTCLFEDNLNVFTWNKTMSRHCHGGEYVTALECFVEMKRLNVACDNVTFVVVLSAVVGSMDLEVGKQIHGLVMKVGFDSGVSVGNNLMNMYAKVGHLDYSQRVFDEMKESDLISWNSMIGSYAQSGLQEESITLFVGLLRSGLFPDQFTLASVLRASSAINKGSCFVKQVHVHALKTGTFTDAFILTALIDVYAKNGRMAEAEFLFNNMSGFDLASWNAMMAGYVAYHESDKALHLFYMIQKFGERSNQFTLATAVKACSCLIALGKGKQIHAHAIKLGFDSDLCVSSGILDMYIKCGITAEASVVFDGISKPDEVAWTAMISGCVENGEEDYALRLYHQMRCLGIRPDEFTLATLVKACSCLAALEQGKQIHANAIKSDHVLDAYVGTSLIDMYAKCGTIEDSYRLFKKMHVKNLASWNAMVVGFAQHGNGREALCLFKNMRDCGIKPDRITFIGVLSACSHSGLVSEARRYFDSMHKYYGIEPEIEHYSCLVDVLGRAGLVNEAEKVIESMPFDASASMSRALLGACRIKMNAEIGKTVATRLLDLEPFDSAAYVLLSNIYAATNQWDKVADARKMMKTRNVKKDPGYSWIEVKNQVHVFVVEDRSHPQAAAIYDKVENLMERIREEGYVPDTDFVLLDVEN